jgi:hypothetical protein
MNLKQRLTKALENWDGGQTTSAVLAEAFIEAAKPKLNPTPWHIDLVPMNYGAARGTQKIYVKDANKIWIATVTNLRLAQQIVDAANAVDSEG